MIMQSSLNNMIIHDGVRTNHVKIGLLFHVCKGLCIRVDRGFPFVLNIHHICKS